jgi:hypothetical protein
MEGQMYSVEGRLCGFGVASNTFFISIDKSLVRKKGEIYFIPVIWEGETEPPRSLIWGLEVTKEAGELEKEGQRYLRSILYGQDWLKYHMGKRITVKFEVIDNDMRVKRIFFSE